MWVADAAFAGVEEDRDLESYGPIHRANEGGQR